MKLHMNLGINSYDIIMERGALQHITDYVDVHRKVMIITDTGVPYIYSEQLAAQCNESYIEVVNQGEASKSFATFQTLCSALLSHNFSRNDLVIAIGGGVIGDVSGYVAASYMRGIDFVQIPTTTLSQIDSSIGGKVAINLDEVKNVVGAFYQPTCVIIDLDTLESLPLRHYHNGLVEAIKAGLIYDPSLFELFEQGDVDAHLEEIIYRSLCVKKAVVEADEREHGLRKILNFGHTIGHAIESYYHLSQYLHGECVAMGMLYFIEQNELRQRVQRILDTLGIPSQVVYDRDVVFDILCRDKKADHDRITVVTVASLGNAILKDMKLEDVKPLLKGANR